MANKGKVKGLAKVNANLSREIRHIRGRTPRGLYNATVLVHRSMETRPPLIPVDTGYLRHSYFTTPFIKPIGPAIAMGFSANYAAHVHEMVGENINWNRPDSGPKFLEEHLLKNRLGILEEIRKAAKID